MMVLLWGQAAFSEGELRGKVVEMNCCMNEHDCLEDKKGQDDIY